MRPLQFLSLVTIAARALGSAHAAPKGSGSKPPANPAPPAAPASSGGTSGAGGQEGKSSTDMEFEPENATSTPPSKTLERAIKLYDHKEFFSASIERKKVLDG